MRDFSSKAFIAHLYLYLGFFPCLSFSPLDSLWDFPLHLFGLLFLLLGSITLPMCLLQILFLPSISLGIFPFEGMSFPFLDYFFLLLGTGLMDSKKRKQEKASRDKGERTFPISSKFMVGAFIVIFSSIVCLLGFVGFVERRLCVFKSSPNYFSCGSSNFPVGSFF